MLHIKNITVLRDQKNIISNCSLSIEPGSTHILMGPNGSGKSTLAYTLMGHPAYQVTSGTLSFNNLDLLALSPDKRAQEGIFLAFQQPIEIPGVSVAQFLKEAYQVLHKITLTPKEFMALLFEALDFLYMDYAFAQRSLNESFSGGEKKRLELLQMLVLKPRFVILDEIDSGLDRDALKLVSVVLNKLRDENKNFAVLCITHYNRLLDYISCDKVHIFKQGTIIASGDQSLTQMVETKGYDVFT